jgi:hypothetical protein
MVLRERTGCRILRSDVSVELGDPNGEIEAFLSVHRRSRGFAPKGNQIPYPDLLVNRQIPRQSLSSKSGLVELTRRGVWISLTHRWSQVDYPLCLPRTVVLG